LRPIPQAIDPNLITVHRNHQPAEHIDPTAHLEQTIPNDAFHESPIVFSATTFKRQRDTQIDPDVLTGHVVRAKQFTQNDVLCAALEHGGPIALAFQKTTHEFGQDTLEPFRMLEFLTDRATGSGNTGLIQNEQIAHIARWDWFHLESHDQAFAIQAFGFGLRKRKIPTARTDQHDQGSSDPSPRTHLPTGI
jgi:hypothetical protein